MKVWVVLRGEDGEGGTIKSVHVDLESAKALALTVDRFWPDRTWRLEVSSDTEYRYHNGCDFVSVEEWEVQERPANG